MFGVIGRLRWLTNGIPVRSFETSNETAADDVGCNSPLSRFGARSDPVRLTTTRRAYSALRLLAVDMPVDV